MSPNIHKMPDRRVSPILRGREQMARPKMIFMAPENNKVASMSLKRPFIDA